MLWPTVAFLHLLKQRRSIATLTSVTGSWAQGLLLGVLGTAALAVLLELSVLRRLYQRDHLSQVLGTFAILLMCNEAVRMIWGPQPLPLNPPEALSGPVELMPGLMYPAYRLLIIGVGLGVALVLYLGVTRTRIGMQVRAGAANREMALAMGVNVPRLFTGVFALGAALCAIDHAATTGVRALVQRGQDGGGGVDAGHEVGHGHAHFLRFGPGLAGHAHQTAFGLDGEVVARFLRQRAGLAVAGDGAVNEARVERLQAGRV